MRLCQRTSAERLTIIAEGLPIILESAQSFLEAARKIESKPREAEVLIGFANEEAAKALILIDIVRCPGKVIASRINHMTKLFYNHLARLLYVEAADWRPMHINQLQEYMDSQRKTHFLEGFCGEYILPNWGIYLRESLLYADMEAYESGDIGWNRPQGHNSLLGAQTANVVKVVEALNIIGVFSLDGLKIVADIWGKVDFSGEKNHHDANELLQLMLNRLMECNLIHDGASQEHVSTLYSFWQIPMYHIDFEPIKVSTEELERERDALLWAEMGYGPGDW